MSIKSKNRLYRASQFMFCHMIFFAIVEVTPTGVTRPKIHDCDATSTWYIQVVYGDSKVHGRSSNFNQCTVYFWGLLWSIDYSAQSVNY